MLTGPAVMMQDVAQVKRKLRSPVHSSQIRTRPFTITPFMIAPVLPGETLKNLTGQFRCVTKPIKNPLVGWWFEVAYYYVKHRDLVQRDALTAMMLDASRDNSDLVDAALLDTYHNGSAPDWTSKCLRRIVEEYYRDEGEAWNNVTIGNLPAARIHQDTWLDSVIDATTMPDVVDDDDMGAIEIDTKFRTWEFMRQRALTNMSYEQWLATYGVRTPKVELHKPELIRFDREWTYPTNTVDPLSGIPSSAAVWSTNVRADKDRYFMEPGFIVGIAVIRPKVYLSKQKSAGVAMMSDAMSWLPAIMRDDPATSLRQYANSAGPLAGNVTNGYWVDVRDLLIHGDQFVNFALNEADANFIDLPTTALQKKYPTATMVDTLFVSAVSPANQVRFDGVTQLNILGAQVDHT